MKPEHEEKITSLLAAYRKNAKEYADLQERIAAARVEIGKLESKRLDLSGELTDLRKQERDFFDAVAKEGVDMDGFKSEINDMLQKME